ncbi:MAG: murein biosynthesis integral membrane protein MurJ, partial [Candidatus Omnitrophica bacterium]|nr:murein biosynthesis integral membrane protein MurJ [Candidatus Omnitrophota bacterium]
MSENKSLIRSARVIGAATLGSRILGFARDVIIAKFFGTGTGAQAFVVAFRIPNLLRRLVGEGSTNSAVVPVLSRLNAQGKDEEFWQVANCLLNVLLILLAGLLLFGELLAPYIVRILAPGFIKDPVKLALTIRLTRFIFPYIVLIGLTAFAMALLNSLRHFTLPALAPCLLNISLITSAIILCPRLAQPIDGLAWGVLIGGALQLLIQVPLLISKGLFKKRFTGLIHPKVKEIGRLFLPRTLGIAVYQANIFIDSILASLAWIVGSGAVAALYYANRIIQFPVALFGLALAQVALPSLSAMAAKNDLAQVKKTVSFSLRNVFTIMIPATVGLSVLAHPVIKILFERGSFTAYSTTITASVLLFYCLGLTGYAGINMLATCFYAMQDTLTPVKAAAWALLINLILNLIFMWPLKAAGLALATAISASFNFMLLLFMLSKRLGSFKGLGVSLLKNSQAAAVMGVVLWLLFYRSTFLTGSEPLLALKLGISIVLGILVY